MWLWIHLLVLLASITVNCSVRYQRKPGFDDGYLAALTVSGSAQRQHTLKTHQTSMDRNPVVLDESTSFPAHSQLHHGAHRQSEVQHGDIRRPLCLHALTMKPGGTSARVSSTCRSMFRGRLIVPLFFISLTPKQLRQMNNPLLPN